MNMHDGSPEKQQIVTGGFREEKPGDHRKSKKSSREKGKYSPVFLVVLCVSVLLFITGAVGLTCFACRCGQTNRDNERYRELHNARTAEDKEQTGEAQGMSGDAEEHSPGAEENSLPAPAVTAEPSPVPVTPEEQPVPQEESLPATSRTPVPSVTFRPYYYDMLSPVLPEMSDLYRINSDVAGWLRIDSIVDLPVVYRNGDDGNEYYLHRNLEKKKSDAGTLFLDEKCPVRSDTRYLLIHGHNMKDGTMFAPIVHYKTKGLPFLKTHPFAEFSTLHETDTYVIFAVCHVSLEYQSSRYIPYYGFSGFDSTEEFDYFIGQLKKHSLYDIPIDVDASDAVLVLSTCLNDDRIIACYRRVRSNEWTSELNSRINHSTAR